MTFKAVLFDFNGVIINDEPIHRELVEEIIISENLRPSESEYKELCLGRSDRACLQSILSNRGRVVSEDYLTKLIANKSQAYQAKIAQLDTLPIYPELKDFLTQITTRGLVAAIVSGALRQEIELVLDREGIANYFSAIVAGDEINASKPEPDGYLLAIERLNRNNPNLYLTAKDCLAIEDTPAGIKAAKQAGMQVVGIANTYPMHMLQRQANWTVDYLSEIELERVDKIFSQVSY